MVRVKMNYVFSSKGPVEKYKGIAWNISTRWCFLSVPQDLQSTRDLSEWWSSHIPWNLYITTNINEIQDTAHGQVTWQLFHLRLIWAKIFSVPRTSWRSLLAKKNWSNLYLKHIFQIGRYSLFLYEWNLYSHSFGCLVSSFPWMKGPCISNVTMPTK